jgi:hypothetical protein
MKISVIIPVVNEQLATGLLNSIVRNTKKPYKLFIVDNTENGFCFPTKILDIHYHRGLIPLSVNASWQLGFDCLRHNDAISVLNDDLLLNKHFFERTERILENKSSVCGSMPFTVDNVADLNDYPLDKSELVNCKKREGWAFTIKTDILEQLPVFPHNKIKTFCFDDWLFLFTNFKSYGKWVWHKDLYNMVWHKGGTSVRKLNKRKDRKPERRLYEEAVQEALKCRN